MIAAETAIPIIYGDDPLVALRVQKRVGSALTPYDLTDATEIEFQVKPSAQGEPIKVYNLAGGVSKTDAPQGRFSVQMLAADIQGETPAGQIPTRRYRVRVQEAGLWRTVMAGPLPQKVV